MTLPEHLLLVDDEPNIRLTLGALLRRAGYAITEADGGSAAIALLERQAFDGMVVDLKMPDVDGMMVIAAARARQPDVMIIVLTGHGSLDSALAGMHQGIFDYVLKTSDPAHMVGQVAAGLAERSQTLRQQVLLGLIGSAAAELTGSADIAPPTVSVLTVGGLRLDARRQQAELRGRTLSLTPTEFRVLLCLAERAGAMVTYRALVQSAQGYETDEQEAGELVKPHIRHLRLKLEPEPAVPQYILNVRGKGYLLNPLPER